MSVCLVTFASPSFYRSQERLVESARRFGIARVHAYTDVWLRQTSFFRDNADRVREPRGWGYWFWKPWVILNSLHSLEPGGIVFYLDAGVEIVADVRSLVEQCERHDRVLFDLRDHPNSTWTKRDCFVYMGCDEARYWHADQVLSGYQLYKRTPENLGFVGDYLRCCLRPELVDDAANTCGLPNLPGFVEHRHDQSVLALLALERGVEPFRDPSQWGDPSARSVVDSPYGTLLHVHRERDPLPLSR